MSPTCSSSSGITGATTYSYDNAGYLKASAAWTGPSSSTTTSYTTNPMGELTTMNTNGATTTYVFDPAGHRVSAQVPSGSGAGTYSYSWDGLGRMLSDSKTGGATTSFSYVGSGFDPSVITAGSSSTYLAYSPQGPLAQKQGSSVSYLATNLHGDVIGLANNGSPPTISSTVAYDPWGAPRPGYTPGSMLGYQGDPTDPATGDVNMQHRLYNPGLGRFITQDSVFGAVTNPTSLNQFIYGNDSPVGNSDPTGTHCVIHGKSLPDEDCPTPPPAPPRDPHCEHACPGDGSSSTTPTSGDRSHAAAIVTALDMMASATNAMAKARATFLFKTYAASCYQACILLVKDELSVDSSGFAVLSRSALQLTLLKTGDSLLLEHASLLDRVGGIAEGAGNLLAAFSFVADYNQGVANGDSPNQAAVHAIGTTGGGFVGEELVTGACLLGAPETAGITLALCAVGGAFLGGQAGGRLADLVNGTLPSCRLGPGFSGVDERPPFFSWSMWGSGGYAWHLRMPHYFGC